MTIILHRYRARIIKVIIFDFMYDIIVALGVRTISGRIPRYQRVSQKMNKLIKPRTRLTLKNVQVLSVPPYTCIFIPSFINTNETERKRLSFRGYIEAIIHALRVSRGAVMNSKCFEKRNSTSHAENASQLQTDFLRIHCTYLAKCEYT